jgi:hypothetical protein
MNASIVANSFEIEAIRYTVCSFGGIDSVPLARARPNPLDQIKLFELTMPTVILSVAVTPARKDTCTSNCWMGSKKDGSELEGGSI